MPVTLDDMMQGLSAERREAIEEEAARLIAESRTLRELRVALGLTQDQVADALETSQSNVAQIESKTDVKVSTVTKVVEALGGRLHLVAILPDRDPVTLRFGEDGITARRVAASVPSVPSVPKVRRPLPVVAEGDSYKPNKHVVRYAPTGRFATAATAAKEMGLGTRAGRGAASKKTTVKGERPAGPRTGPSGRGSRSK